MKFLFLILTTIFFLENNFASDKLYLPFIVDLNKLEAMKSNELQKGSIDVGKNIFKSRAVNCLSCHEAPIPEERFHGNFGPSLIGIGSKYKKAEIRIRVIDAKLINPETIMPSYFKIQKTQKNLTSFFYFFKM